MAMNEQEYVALKGIRCPYCKSDNIVQGSNYDHSGTQILISVACQDCREEWDDVYTLTSFEPLQS